MKPLFLYNTLSRSVEEFRPIQSGEVTYYSCGPTVYLPQHLGNMRAFLFTDTVRRVLEFNGYRVRHVMNITDVGHMTSNEDSGEDKIEKTARAEGKSPKEIADHYTDLFLSDTDRLNIERPIILSRATDHIADMIALIERIIARGYAYVVKSAVYFDVEKYRGEKARASDPGPHPLSRVGGRAASRASSDRCAGAAGLGAARAAVALASL